MSLIARLVSLDNPVFNGYITYGSILVLKMLTMSALTTIQRIKHRVPPSSEDRIFLFGRPGLISHEAVDRVRRAHLNDLENIPLFFMAGFAYLLTDPDANTALNLFRIYTIARCVHTFVYAVYVVSQPTRAISYSVAFYITVYMVFKVICHFNAF